MVSSGVGRTGCWHVHKSLRKHAINFISMTIDKLYHRCAGKIFNFNFSCNVVVQCHEMTKNRVKIRTEKFEIFSS